MTMPDGGVFEGTWKDGLLNGPGRATYPDGSVYVGDFVNGQRQGQGRIELANGREYEGLWEAGQPVAPVNAVLPATDAPPTEPAEAVE